MSNNKFMIFSILTMEIQIHTNLCLHMCTYRHIGGCMQTYAHIYSIICIFKVVPLNGHLREPCIPPKTFNGTILELIQRNHILSILTIISSFQGGFFFSGNKTVQSEWELKLSSKGINFLMQFEIGSESNYRNGFVPQHVD